MTPRQRRSVESGLRVVGLTETSEAGTAEAPPVDAVEALLLAQAGYHAAADAANGAKITSLTDFVI